MIEVPDEKTITGLTRTELIALVYTLQNERDDLSAALMECMADRVKRMGEQDRLTTELEALAARCGW